MICGFHEYNYTLIIESKGSSREQDHDWQQGLLIWKLLIPFVLQFVITLLTRDYMSLSLSPPLALSLTHKDAHAQNADSHRNVWTHTVYIMRYAHTVNRPIHCVYTLNLTNSYTNKSKSSLKSDQLQ